MKRKKVLVVDDELSMLQVLDFAFGTEDFEVITANNGELALEKAKEEKPDIIILDIMMPVLDGYETCRRLKRTHETKLIPVVFLSAKRTNIDRKLAIDVGGVDYFIKPFSPGRLIVRVQEILGVTT